ncbi:MAG: tRNA guanosine(34) transglycosylase Tgt [Alphaproteobacteria bacterium]
MQFTLEQQNNFGRAGFVKTARGAFLTPAFMPVATQGAMKAMRIDDLKTTHADIILANSYHLFLRPGLAVIKKHQGLHQFMNWQGPILTDSGGFQIMSLSKLTTITDDGVWFQSPHDGKKYFFDPPLVMHIQHILNSDIAMVLDQCIGYPADKTSVAAAMKKSNHWAKICRSIFKERTGYGVFGIVQGGLHSDLREEAVKTLLPMDFHGIAIGGLAVGEGQQAMLETLTHTIKHLPKNKPRYLMGVGKPDDIIKSVELGCDMFDCVLPARSGRHGQVFLRGKNGKDDFANYQTINIKNAKHRLSPIPLDSHCRCPACQHYSRAYLNHLFHAGEILSMILLTWHNQMFYQDLINWLRQRILTAKK